MYDNSWAHEICSEDNEERALVIGSMNEMAYVFQAWLPLLVWQQVDAPEYRKGFITVACISLALVIITFVIRRLDQLESRRRYVIATEDYDRAILPYSLGHSNLLVQDPEQPGA